MERIIMQNSDIGNFANSPGAARTKTQTAKPAPDKSASPEQRCIILELDELSEDPELRKRQLHEAVRNAYAEVKAEYEASHKDVTKNGTDSRQFILLDPVDGNPVEITEVLQKYYSKTEKRTRVFYGGIFMPRVPYLICQVITVLAEKAASEKTRRNDEEKQPCLKEFCESWGITEKLYCSFFARVKQWFGAVCPDHSMKQFRDYLARLSYGLWEISLPVP